MVREKNQNTEYDLFHFTCLTVERTAASLSLEKRENTQLGCRYLLACLIWKQPLPLIGAQRSTSHPKEARRCYEDGSDMSNLFPGPVGKHRHLHPWFSQTKTDGVLDFSCKVIYAGRCSDPFIF